MRPLLLSLALLAFAWLVHLIWWRVALPRRHSAALLALVAAVPLAAVAVTPLLPPAWAPGVAEAPSILALYLGAAACYLIIYTAIEHESPTIVIVRALDRAGPQGCSAAELAQVVTDDVFIRPRLEALAVDGVLVHGAD